MLFSIILSTNRMRHFLWLLCGATGMAVQAHACDVCSSGASSQTLGLLPNMNRHFISVQYQYSGYESDHPSLFAGRPNEESREAYHTLQVWGRYAIKERLQLFAFLPYKCNVQHSDTSSYTNKGMGDATLLANVLTINTAKTSGLQHQLLTGLGLKLPTGSYMGITEMDKLGLPNMQPGTGSWDVMVNGNYTMRAKLIGINADAAYTFTSANKDAYKYGNRLNAGVTGFYQVKTGKMGLLPQVGVRCEYSMHDYDNYSRKWLNEQSGGYICFATAGIQGYRGSIGARLMYQLPVSQHYSAGYVTAKNRVDAGVFFLF